MIGRNTERALTIIEERRFKIWYVDQAWLTLVFQRLIEHDRADSPTWAVRTGSDLHLPADAIVDAVNYCFARRAFAVVLGSMEFDPVPDGAEIPLLPPANRTLVLFAPAESVQRHPERYAGVTPGRAGFAGADGSAGNVGASVGGGAGGSCEVFGTNWGAVSPENVIADLASAREKILASASLGPADGAYLKFAMERANEALKRPIENEFFRSEVKKLDARLALEYDLFRLLNASDGSPLGEAIDQKSTADLTEALALANAGKIQEAGDYLTR